MRNLYWDSQIAKKFPVLKPWRLRNLKSFLSFSYYSFKDTITYFDEDMFQKESFLDTNSNS